MVVIKEACRKYKNDFAGRRGKEIVSVRLFGGA